MYSYHNSQTLLRIIYRWPVINYNIICRKRMDNIIILILIALKTEPYK